MSNLNVSFNPLVSGANTSVSSSAGSSTDTGFSDILNAASGGKTNLDAIFDAASKKYNISANLLKAVAKAESNFRPDATSHCGAMGIMQLMPATARSLGVTDAYDPEQNIMGGAKYLRQMLDKFDGDVQLALAGYNAGPGAVTKYGGIPPYSETQNYVKKIMGYLDGEITAGKATNTRSTDSSVSSGAVRGDSDTAADYAERARNKNALTEMILMKVLEMQMKSDDDKETSLF